MGKEAVFKFSLEVRPMPRERLQKAPVTLNPVAIFIWGISYPSALAGQILNSTQLRLWIGRFWRGPQAALLSKERTGNPRKGTGVGRDLSCMGTAGVKIQVCRWAG